MSAAAATSTVGHQVFIAVEMSISARTMLTHVVAVIRALRLMRTLPLSIF